MALSHNLSNQYLHRDFECSVVEARNHIPSLILLRLEIFLHGLRDGQIITFTLRDVRWVLPFASELGNSVN